MHSIVCLTFFIALLTCTFASDVLVLTDNDFESKAQEYDILLAEFYAPWCGHCKLICFLIKFDCLDVIFKVNILHRNMKRLRRP